MKNIIRFTLSLMLMALLLSCGNSDDDIFKYRFPLDVGNSWTMHVTYQHYDLL